MVWALAASLILVACAASARRFLATEPHDDIIRVRIGFGVSCSGLLLGAIGLWELVGGQSDQARPWGLVGATLVVSAALAADVAGAAMAVLFGLCPVVAAVVFLQLLVGPGDGPGPGWLVVAGACTILPVAAVVGWIAGDDL